MTPLPSNDFAFARVPAPLPNPWTDLQPLEAVKPPPLRQSVRTMLVAYDERGRLL